MQAVNFEEVVDTIAARDKRYLRDAYFFVREALNHTRKRVKKSRECEDSNVTGQELLEGIRDYALQEFGPMALTVLEEWGIRRCEDFGEVVFNMVEDGLLAKTEQDSRADFKNGYAFEDAFRRPFLPTPRNPSTAPETKPA